MRKKPMTIEDLARMVQKGFSETATKQEFLSLREEFYGFRRDVHECFNTMEDDIKDVKITLGPLVRIVAAFDVDMRNLHARVSRLERKMGTAK